MPHNFIKEKNDDPNSDSDYYCLICNIIAFYSFARQEMPPHGRFIIYTTLNNFKAYDHVTADNITCEEFIIKNIIE